MRRKTLNILLFVLLLLPLSASASSPARVSYLGPAGTYTEEAARFFFQNGETLIPLDTVDKAIAAVLSGEADYAVIPQENTLGGAVAAYVDALIGAREAFVVGEVVLPISQTLMGLPGAKLQDIRTVYSHAQGLTQSARWRTENLPDARAVEMGSTAAAASFVAQSGDKTIAAVAAPGAAQLYGLEVLAENVQLSSANKTRFYVLSKALINEPGLPRALFLITCTADWIDDILIDLHNAGLELVTLHDRPEGSRLGSYHYQVEVECPDGVTPEQIALACSWEGVRFAGCFRAAEKTN